MRHFKWFWIFMIFSFISVESLEAFASGNMMWPLQGQITSDYGYRISPGGGVGSTNHKGIDIGGEYGEPVVAAADGVVTYAGWGDGYGYYVEIDHGGGLTTGYGHNQEVAVAVGQEVKRGDTVAYCGSTGHSTGPHVHFEVCMNGEPQPPYEYLGVAYTGMGGLPQDEDLVPVDYSIFYSFAAPMGDMIGILGAACTSGLKILQGAMLWLFILLITMDLAWAFTWSLFNRDDVAGLFPFLLKKLIVYGVLLFCIQNWGVVLDAVRNYFVSSAAVMFSADIDRAVAIVSNPAEVIEKGMQLAAPYFNYISSFTNPLSIALYQLPILIVFIFGVLLVAIFLLLGLQMMLAYIEFYVMGAFSVISISLGGFQYTRQWPIAFMGINGLIASGIKLMWFTFFALMLNLLLSNVPDSSVFQKSGSSGNIDGFMQAVGDIESGGDYQTPANAFGARGKYQILESNWPGWCVEAGLPENAAWTPENQDFVACFKMEQYYAEYGNWRDAAIAWNAGSAWVGSESLPAETIDYLAKLEGKMNGVNTSFDFVAAIERFLFVLVMALIGSKISGRILETYCSGGGFRWSSS